MKRNNNLFVLITLSFALILTTAACQGAELAVDPAEVEAESTAIAAESTAAASGINDVFSSVYPPQDPNAATLTDLPGAITTESGLQFLEIEPGEGSHPKDGDIVLMNFVAALPDGTEFGNSYTQGGPAEVILGRGQLLEGWEEGVKLMSAGSSARIVIPPALAFGEEAYGMIPANSPIIMMIELISIEKPPKPKDFSRVTLTTTESGLAYFDLADGEGEPAMEGQIVSNHFTIWVQGEEQDLYIGSSEGASPISFQLGKGDTVFLGWEEGATGMKVGGIRYLEIPAELGLGDVGGGDIPPGATLLMEIELLEIKDPIKMTKVDDADYTTTDTGLMYYDILVGEGESPSGGDTVVVHYTGWLEDGTQFDSSVDRGEPFAFTLGMGQVIPGWDEGLATMKIGGKRQLKIPAELGYGDAGSGSLIPPGATLIFDVELISITAGE